MRYTRLFSILVLLIFAQACQQIREENTQTKPYKSPEQRPRLVVGIVVDQMRQEYLSRFYHQFGDGGFKRLMKRGFQAKNGHYNYIPTYTGPGHASVYSGTTPATHGIIGNNWYSRELGRSVYCAEDTSVNTVGSESNAGKMSPRNLISSTIGDEMKLFSQGRSKVIGVSIKDRSAIIPAGHMADGAYWYDRSIGGFITSTYYKEVLPSWVEAFNARKLADQYLEETWELLHPIEKYRGSGPDDSPYERVLKGKDNATFPYDLAALKEENGGYDLITYTPWGNTLVTDIALAALHGENLGDDEYDTDLLAVSYSSPDILGHAYGTFAKELEDMYARLDREIERLLKALDEKVGRGNYTVFLTADHAVADIPSQVMDMKLSAGYFKGLLVVGNLRKYLSQKYGEGDWVESASNEQIFLNHATVASKKLNLYDLQREVADWLLTQTGVSMAYTAHEMRINEYTKGLPSLLQMGYRPNRSGDVLIQYDPSWLAESRYAGTTHGSGFTYDTHVPMLFYGWGIPKGSSVKYQKITDIAPTITTLLNIKFTNGNTGQPIEEIFK